MYEVKFHRIAGNNLPLPSYATPGAAAMDLRACLPNGPVSFIHGDLKMISTGFNIELPAGTEMQIRPRSGLALKHGFMIPNSPGTIDEDYRGCIMIGLYYIGHAPFVICHGDRIAQAVISKVYRYSVVEVTELSETKRGTDGFGSTGIA